jgi:FAD dependent oxidoreductase
MPVHIRFCEIPQCWLTGQAAGVAAALAASTGTRPRDVVISAIQRELLRQGAYLSPAIANVILAPQSARRQSRLLPVTTT